MNRQEILSFDSDNKGSRELIIQVLSYKWPLRAKELHNYLKREYAITNTYQSTHKAIKELEDRNIISRQGNEYSLDKEWINKTFSYLEKIKLNYHGKNQGETEKKTLQFDDYTEFVMTMADLFDSKKLMGEEFHHLYGIGRHLFWPLRFDFEDFKLCAKVGLEAQPRVITKGNTPFDKFIKEHYKIANWKEVVIGADLDIDEDVVVQGCSIVQIKYTEETKKEIDEIYLKIRNLQDLFKFYLEKRTIKIHAEMKITKDCNLAKIVRNDIKSKIEANTQH